MRSIVTNDREGRDFFSSMTAMIMSTSRLDLVQAVVVKLEEVDGNLRALSESLTSHCRCRFREGELVIPSNTGHKPRQGRTSARVISDRELPLEANACDRHTQHSGTTEYLLLSMMRKHSYGIKCTTFGERGKGGMDEAWHKDDRAARMILNILDSTTGRACQHQVGTIRVIGDSKYPSDAYIISQEQTMHIPRTPSTPTTQARILAHPASPCYRPI